MKDNTHGKALMIFTSEENSHQNSVSGEEDRYAIHAHSSKLTDQRTRIIKYDEMFAVFNVYGDIWPVGGNAQGIYHGSTRLLSRLEIRLDNQNPLLLSSTVTEDNSIVAVDLMNPDFHSGEGVFIPRGTLHLQRSKLLWKGAMFEEVTVTNFSSMDLQFHLSFLFGADFADIFEIRGMERKQRGQYFPPHILQHKIRLGYQGLDGLHRETQIELSPPPAKILGGEGPLIEALFEVHLPAKATRKFALNISYGREYPIESFSFSKAYAALSSETIIKKNQACLITTSNEIFNEWIHRSLSDLHMLTTQTPFGDFPFAGVPWYSTPFGRDGIITALLSLWINPDLARGVLSCLCHFQAKTLDAQSDAEPGKILHEAREGEMANTGEVPFKLYYGSIDSTPLYLVLAGRYYQASGDLEFIKRIWPSLKLALHWIDEYGDRDGDGFVEYFRRSDSGLINQGWKDSHDSIFSEDGSMAEGPIALCEVQGYVYEAKREAARLASLLGEEDFGRQLEQEAQQLKVRFDKAFWCEEISSYALALDGQKKQCKILSSNAGHCLFSGIAREDRARQVADGLFEERMFSGWGVRTVATSEALYNPMSYHNGSVWPHDNAMIALGLARYGFNDLIWRLLEGLFEASYYVDLHRLPELFCGFPKREHEGPTLYPVACIPQAWATVTVFALLQAALGLQPDAPGNKITFYHPGLPPYLKRLEIKNLRLKGTYIDLSLHHHIEDVGLNIDRRTGPVEVVIIK